MFYLNLGYRWKLPSELERLHGVVLLPSKNSIEKVRRSNRTALGRILFDPQLYLAELDARTCAMACGRLVTYPWFSSNEGVDFDSDRENQRKWERRTRDAIASLWTQSCPQGDDISLAAQDCIGFQEEIGCERIITPSPLITEREDEASTQGEWLDASVGAAEELEITQPLLASVVLKDTSLNAAGFEGGGFLDTVVDQVASRDGIDGVYIVVVQTDGGHPFTMKTDVLRAYLHLVEKFSAAGFESVVVNFADVFGVVCRGMGASSFATGPSQGLRKMSLASFEDDQRGIALPNFYSHRAVCEFRSETDLDEVVAAKMLRRVRDITPYSRGLMSTLAAGGSAASLAEWAESKNNIQAAQRHFISRMFAVESKLRELDGDDRLEVVREWLDDAQATSEFVIRRLKGREHKLRGTVAPTDSWAELLDELEE